MANRQYYILPLLATVGCGGLASVYGIGADQPAGGTALPLANAGADREILRGYPARLDGLATTHTADQPISFAWTQTAGEPVYLSSPSEPAPTFVAPLEEQTLTFKLTATDGVWSTTDRVSLLVRKRPARSAPQLLAGADRVLDFNEAPEPDADDIPDGVPADVEPTWERIEPVLLDYADSVLPQPAVFRLTGARDGLSSAPDYLLLYPYDEVASLNVAPTASLRGPTQLEPGEPFRLDASTSSDPNGDVVRLRWVQTRGDPLLPGGDASAKVSMHAPARPQTLVFRVYVRDAALESAAGKLEISVSAANEMSVHPGQDRRTRPGREVQLDAQAGILAGTQLQTTATYAWAQTLGAPVDLATDADGRIATFEAPAAPDELAFAVVGTLAGVESAPAVIRISVVEEDDNLPPTIFHLSASSTTPLAGASVEISTLVIDPEADPLGACDLTAEPPGAVDLPVCDATAFPDGSGAAKFDVTAPSAGTAVTITLTVCDDRDACDVESVRIVPQQ